MCIFMYYESSAEHSRKMFIFVSNIFIIFKPGNQTRILIKDLICEQLIKALKFMKLSYTPLTSLTHLCSFPELYRFKQKIIMSAKVWTLKLLHVPKR